MGVMGAPQPLPAAHAVVAYSHVHVMETPDEDMEDAHLAACMRYIGAGPIAAATTRAKGTDNRDGSLSADPSREEDGSHTRGGGVKREREQTDPPPEGEEHTRLRRARLPPGSYAGMDGEDVRGVGGGEMRIKEEEEKGGSEDYEEEEEWEDEDEEDEDEEDEDEEDVAAHAVSPRARGVSAHSSRFPGVTWREASKKWAAAKHIRTDAGVKKNVHLGLYANKQDAARAVANYVEHGTVPAANATSSKFRGVS
jgi:hypothetical protein